MAKLGREYETVVASVFQSFDQSAKVERGKWVLGPDGRRELDVVISGFVGNQFRTAIIECKDFAPNTTGAVGIAHVDALDSKRRDLQASDAIMCCNAGFTADASRKASRVGIGLIGVLKKGDPRLRHKVVDTVYFRKVRLVSSFGHFSAADACLLHALAPTDLCFEDRPVANWIHKRAMEIIGTNPVVSGTYSATHRFKMPLEFASSKGVVTLTRLDISFTIEGSWYSHQTVINSSAGVYDWLRKRVRLTPGKNSIEYEGIDFDKGKKVDFPSGLTMFDQVVQQGEAAMELLIVDGVHKIDFAPDLDTHVIDEDKSPRITNLEAAPHLPSRTATPNGIR